MAQDTQDKYQRKSISFIDAVLPVGDNVQLGYEQEKFLLKTIKDEIEMSRFDYNPLPDEILLSFRNEAKSRSTQNLDDLAAVMEDVLVPEILRLVDLAKEMRAQGLVSEAEKHSFVVEKAKESGITTENLEAVMNSAYIYVPVISQVKEYTYADKNMVNYELHGGIIWFSVKTGEAGASVTLLVKKETVGKGAAKVDAQFTHKGKVINGKQYAFVTAAEVLARNLKVATQEIPEFQLTNPLANTGSGWVEFSMGKREGLGVDDKFIIAEYYENADGSTTREELGMVRVSRVADNRSKRADSKARVVIGGGYERGMIALEHPRLPIDISVRLGMLPIGGEETLPHVDHIHFEEDISSTITVGQLWFNYNLARSTQISQLFASIYGEFGVGTLDGASAFGDDLESGLYWGIGGGLVKKFYVNRIHLGIEALLSYSNYTVSGTNANDHDWEWDIGSIGMTFNGNIEIALAYDWNFGAGVSYRMFAPNGDWTYTLNDEEIDLSPYNDVPELDYSGIGFQVYLTWSLPSLGYDPLKMARGAVGY